MDYVMMDYLARKLGPDYARGNQGGDYNRGGDMNYPARNDYGRGSYNVSGQYDNAGRDMNYPARGDMGQMPPMDMRNDYGYPMDMRQGVKGTGPYGIGGSMHYGRRDRADAADYGCGMDYNRGQGDYHKFKMPKLTKAEKHQWEQSMQNTDGTRGPHYDMQQVMQTAEKLGIRFNHFEEKDLALIMNMFYSDYGQVVKKYMPQEKEIMFLADMAKAYFDDPDGPEPDDKLSRQYHCMSDHD